MLMFKMGVAVLNEISLQSSLELKLHVSNQVRYCLMQKAGIEYLVFYLIQAENIA